MPKPDRIRLFGFPYAGASAAFYRSWSRELPSWIEVSPVELPGRGARVREKPVSRMSALVDECAAAITVGEEQRFAFFGHSLGAIIAFETAVRLQESHESTPVRLFVSAHRAPHLPLNTGLSHHLSDDLFLKRVHGLGGLSDEVLAHPELMHIVLPALRADFTLYETYERNRLSLLHVPISAFGGTADSNVPDTSLRPWKDHTAQECEIRTFPGGHFFLHSARSELLAEIARILRHS
jgi:medium-chain acyl-[acyl-carrier-protein] hydrolase